jgi:hypothetical protein
VSTQGGGDRVTNRQLYEELTRLRTELAGKNEMRLTVALGVAGGNAIAALLLKFTSTGEVVQSMAGHLLGLI